MTSMEQQIEDMHENIDTKLHAATMVIHNSMTEFIAQISNFKSAVSLEQETNSIKSEKSGTDNSAGSKRPASLEETGIDNLKDDKMSGRRKSSRINPPSIQNPEKGIAKAGEQTTVPILKPGEAETSSGKT